MIKPISAIFVMLIASNHAMGTISELKQLQASLNTEFSAELEHSGLQYLVLSNEKKDNRFRHHLNLTSKFEQNSAGRTIGKIGITKGYFIDGTSLSLYFSVCHELGHLIGGSPSSRSGDHSTDVEGQADYFATAKCLPRLYKALEAKVRSSIGKYQQCNLQELERRAACNFAIQAGLDTLNAWYKAGTKSLGPQESYGDEIPNLDNLDLEQTSQTYNGHPKNNCRLATIVAGALCSVSTHQSFDPKDESAGACEFGKIGGRPSCWYRPGTAVIDTKY